MRISDRMHSSAAFDSDRTDFGSAPWDQPRLSPGLKELCAKKGPRLGTDEIVAWIERIGGFETNAELVAFAKKMKARQYARMLEDEDERSGMGADKRGLTLEGGILEKMIGSQPTSVTIDFLETGLSRARSVARVICPDGVGSGFLTRDNLLITSSLVISSREERSGPRSSSATKGAQS